MKIIKLSIFALLGLVIIVSGVWFIETHPSVNDYLASSLSDASENLAAVFFQQSITVAGLNQKYKSVASGQNKINLLIIPGHEPNSGGAEFGKLKERDMTVDLGNYLAGFLENNNHYGVTITRDKQNWNPIFSNYFTTNWNAIIAFVENQKSQMRSLVDVGLVKSVSGAYHVDASQDVALRLYGVNKWVNENNIDIEIHIHFNDFPRRHQNLPGEYSGLTIYVPESQYSNSTTTRAIATAVLSRLSRYNAVSDLPTENAGIVEDQDLIAIGSNNNADAASFLIEYGYIYEPQFQDPAIRDMTLKDLAYQTYLGLEDFFGQKISSSVVYDTLMLPHDWQKNISKTSSGLAATDILALQSALVIDGEYPTEDKSKNDCPRSGIFGNCTIDALKEFQNKYNIKGESGTLGTKTRAVLNSMFGS
jgi:N-acetylmuramoyl-L-alanine amidase